ncbi:hypothetical protein P167DRAFT_546428 [Morchella conica CCBAS932]|uniref:Uncharacterized protein n=1 Tax=Morchella conica CCBAS932 TaxID=1392247 RepID=A0A3N4KLB6_9PEZI|nr:hypothetical protein P167DRAFT_546428 [Morchella conica CCBAS932]
MKLPVLVTRALIEREFHHDDDDDEDGPGGSSGQGKSLIVAVVFVAVLLFSLFIYVGLRLLRRSVSEPPTWLPEFVRSWWTKWRPGTYIPTPISEREAIAAATAASSMSSRHTDRSTNYDSRRDRHSSRRDRHRENPTQGIDRNTSIRSIMTLPEYRPVASPGKERTIGREGERAGIDVVLEFPESSTEEEQRREEHMQALYEIRLARQLERAEARENAANGGSRSNRHASPGSDRGRNRDGSSSTSLAAALAAVSERDRRLANVAYAEVGTARPDGSRVRASSTASERDNQPLLSSGASMGRHGRSVSIESVEMFSARPSMETRPPGSSSNRQVSGVRSMLDVDRETTPPPPDYGGPPTEPPPDYDQLHDLHDYDGQHGNTNMQVPLLRVEAASPEPSSLPTYPSQAR